MEESPVKFALVDINEILKTLPHRNPFLLIDRVKNIRADYSGIGVKNVSFAEPCFQGHFPERPVYPGVLMIEGMAQTAGVLVQRIMPPTAPDKRRVIFFLTIDKAKFRKPARPGDVIAYHVDKLSRRRSMWWYRAEAKVNDVVIAEAEVGAYLAEE